MCGTAKLNEPLSEIVGAVFHRLSDAIQQLMKGDEGRPLNVPVGVFQAQLEVQRHRKSALEKLNHRFANFQGEVNFGWPHNGNSVQYVRSFGYMSTPPLVYRAVFISDLHLGSASADVEAIHEFLHQFTCEDLYLVGDIVDLWVARPKGKWNQASTNVIRSLLGKTKHGCRVKMTPGNHDADFRKLNGSELGNLSIDDRFVHETLDGRRFLVVHGDYCDRSVTSLKLIAVIGAWIHELTTGANNRNNALREKRGLPPKDYSGGLKRLVKKIVGYVTSFQDRICEDADREGFDGVICGHIHQPAFETHESGVLYINTGDWMSHCTALVEHTDGRLELIRWKEVRETVENLRPVAVAGGPR